MLRIIDLHVPISSKESLIELAARRLKLPPRDIAEVVIVRRALDARRYHGAPIEYVYILDVIVKGNEKQLQKRLSRDRKISWQPDRKKSVFAVLQSGAAGRSFDKRPVVVGFGPAGMLAALTLAKAGLCPLVLERGADVDTRRNKVNAFWQGGELDEETNVQFGEGGAGTFSDGKLTTRISDPGMDDILDVFVEFGAPEEIKYLHKPHIGTDLLCGMVKNLRQEIIKLGGEIRFLTKVTDVVCKNNAVTAVIVNDSEEIACDAVFLGIGHSARDTYGRLYEQGFIMEPKAFAVGVRIEHPQELIDRKQYGEDADNPDLSAADYALTFKDTLTGRGAYSFCMCPGGQVVAAASEKNRVVTNGMSLYQRNSGIANAALLVNVTPEDFGGTVLGGIALQRKYEAAAFVAGGSDYRAPVQAVGDFLTGRTGTDNFCITPTYLPGVKPANLKDCLPAFVCRTLADALPYFDHKINGFAAYDVPMTGVEMRSSAPCRICRDRETYEAIGKNGIYPVGEGAGYAGGIMSAAVDGMNAALAFLAKFGHTIE